MNECSPEAESETEVVTVFVTSGDCVITRVTFADRLLTEVFESSGDEVILNESDGDELDDDE